MKKTILTLLAVISITALSAQKNKVQSAFNYNNAFERNGKCSEIQNGLEAINLATQDASTKDMSKTWIYRGNLYYNLLLPTTDKNCKALYKEALDEATESYLKGMVLNFEDEALKKLDLEKEADLVQFFGALQNKSKMEDQQLFGTAFSRLPGLGGEYANKGIGQFQNKDFKGAQESFQKGLMLIQFSGKTDTLILYNLALASEYAEDFETAKQLYNALIQLNYNIDGNGASIYQSLARIHKNGGDKEKSFETIKKGRKAYPQNQHLIFEEIDYYLQSGKDQEALVSLNDAISIEPNNAFLYYVRGTVYEKLKDQDNAIADYKKSIELDSKQHDAAFNLGAFYFNKGVDKINIANDLPLNQSKKYEEMKTDAKKDFMSAIPYIEMANKAKPEDTDTATMLIKLYTQVGEDAKAKELKAKYE